MSLLDDISAPYALIGGTSRLIGTIVPEVVVEETHQDDLVITAHPVADGAAVSDHAYKAPPLVQMRCGFSNSTAQTEGYVQAVYQEFLSLQAERQPFDVSTGKRSYSNMLIRSIQVVTAPDSEYALSISVGLQGVIISSPQMGGSGGSGSTISNANVTPSDATSAGQAPSTDSGFQPIGPAANVPTFAQTNTLGYYTAPVSPPVVTDGRNSLGFAP